MSISFGRKNTVPAKQVQDTFAAARTASIAITRNGLEGTQTSLVDLRSPDMFSVGFIPGSYNVPDLACVAAAQRTGLFRGRKIYLLADDPEQLQLCSETGDLGAGAEIAGWFAPDAIEEWRKMNSDIGSIEAITSDTLSIRMAAQDTLVFDIYQDGEERKASHPSAMNFRLADLPLSLDGLPPESLVCLTARTSSLASFSASLLWNFGFHKVCYLSSGRRVSFPLAS